MKLVPGTTVKKEFRARRKLVDLLAGVVWLTSWATAHAQRPSTPPSGQFEWRFSLKQNQVAPSNITAQNICFKRHRFQIDAEDLPPFMRLLGPPTFTVNPHNQYSVPVEFDSTGLKAGQSEGLVTIKCVTCPREKGCAQDRQLLHIHMTVLATEPEMTGTRSAEHGPPAVGTSRPSRSFVPGRVLMVIPLGSSETMADTAKEIARRHGLVPVEVHPLISISAGLVVFAITDGTDVLTKVAELGANAQPDWLYRAEAHDTDLYAQLQYGPKLIRADRLHGSVTGEGIKVTLVDTGLDGNHPALRGKVLEQIDMTGKGFTPDTHGTLLAGIVAAEPNNGIGISGVAPRTEILAVKACQPQAPQAVEAECWSLTLARGLDFAIQKAARVINLSLGGPKDMLVTRLVDEAVNRGSVVVAAAGNDGPRGQPSFPAALPNVIAVTAVDAQEQLYAEATQGDFIDLAAPGVEILSTGPGNKFLVSSGTSLATAFVTGTVALALQQHPGLSPQAVQALLEQTAKDLGPPGKDPQFGSGLVDACKAVAQLNGDQNLCR